jgi:hypothetical protein
VREREREDRERKASGRYARTAEFALSKAFQLRSGAPKAGCDLAGSSRRASWSTDRAHPFVIAGLEVQQCGQAEGSLVDGVAFIFFVSKQ